MPTSTSVKTLYIILSVTAINTYTPDVFSGEAFTHKDPTYIAGHIIIIIGKRLVRISCQRRGLAARSWQRAKYFCKILHQ